MIPVNREDLPGAYRSASTAAQRYQKQYFRLMYWQVALPVVSAVLALCSYWVPVLAQVGAVAVVAAMVVAGFVGVARPDRLWHRNRALAEFGKSQAWRFMMAAEPFPPKGAAGDAEQAFHNALATVADNCRETKALAAGARAGQVSDVMRQVRDLPFQDRMQIYVKQRVSHQLDYYRTNSAHSNGAREGLYMTTLVMQLVVAAVALIYAVRSMPLSVLGLLISIPAALTGWLRFSRHDDLAPSYEVAGNRLAQLHREAGTVTTEQEFRIYVSRVEDLLTTEHAEWLIRRS